MPIVRVDITGPKPAEYRSAVLRGVRKAIVDGIGAPDDRVSVRIIETPAEDCDAPSWRSDRFTVVEVLLYAGRTDEMKLATTAMLRDLLSADPGIPVRDVSVVFHDMAPADLHVLQNEANQE